MMRRSQSRRFRGSVWTFLLLMSVVIGCSKRLPQAKEQSSEEKSKLIEINGKVQVKSVFIPWRERNDKGQIVGTGLYHGQYSTFLLTPMHRPKSK